MIGKKPNQRLLGAVSAALLWSLTGPASGQTGETPDITKIEEDWALVLNVPDDSANCPQFHTIMSPTPNLDDRYFQVNWNYQEQPEFAGGGLELLNWSGDTLLQHKTMKTEQLSTTAETITWTQMMYCNGEILAFLITNGTSTTWGSFATTTWGSTPGLANLNSYSTAVSVDNSWITFGSNRVDLLLLKSVRYYDEDGTLIATDDTPRVVYQAPEDEE